MFTVQSINSFCWTISPSVCDVLPALSVHSHSDWLPTSFMTAVCFSLVCFSCSRALSNKLVRLYMKLIYTGHWGLVYKVQSFFCPLWGGMKFRLFCSWLGCSLLWHTRQCTSIHGVLVSTHEGSNTNWSWISSPVEVESHLSLFIIILDRQNNWYLQPW